jgi:signal transduction histidine kinase
LLHNLLPATDGLVKSLSAAPEGRDREVLRAMILAEQNYSRTTARLFRRLLYVASLLLIGLLIRLALVLRARALALRRQATLEHLLAGISMRFVNSQPEHIDALAEQALAEMATCIDADRAYFALFGPTVQLHTWCSLGVSFPPGWPDQVPMLIARFKPSTDGVIKIPNISRLPAGDDKDACTGFGLKGWACASNTSESGFDAVLGFDAVRRPCRMTHTNELNLLPVALDTIANAARRRTMELEKARLEQRLQQARRMETVGAFASGIAHNFNNIVGAILGYTEMAETRATSDQSIARDLTGIRRAGERARDLVEQILDFGSHHDSRRRPVDVKNLLSEAKSLLDASLPSTVDVMIFESSQSATVSAEPTQLQQAIFNLCSNAAQAMDGIGCIEIEERVNDVSQSRRLSHGELMPGRYSCISVSDSGCGMDEAVLERVFEPFFTTRRDGNGLGLATAHEVVLEYGGAMHAESTPGVGSRFEIWLPCISMESDATGGVQRSLHAQGETLLVIDDNHDVLMRTEEILAALGYEPIGFSSADDALASYGTILDQFDAFLIGHQTRPKAVELAAQLHEIMPNTPIVLATVSVQDISARTLMAAGVSEVVSRPLVASEIAAALARFASPEH